MNSLLRHVLLLSIVGVSSNAMAQSPDSLPPVPNVPVALSFFAPIIFPVKVIQDEAELRDFVTSREFALWRTRNGDPGAVDLLFRRSLQLCWGNTGEALLICMLATFDHRTLGLRLPLVGFVLWLPLTGEFQEDFDRRVRDLPSHLYADTPPEGDRDKLQHFFGSAWLTLVFDSPESADDLGEFIETGEEAFVVGGVRDDRDVRANRDGQRFGMALMSRTGALPSEFFGH
ncbi:MAG: hypothetical protein WB699_17960 [Bacteroidota bacterium]